MLSQTASVWDEVDTQGQPRRSRPSRGTWIETPELREKYTSLHGRALRGARGLKHLRVGRGRFGDDRRALRGARGLKLRMPERACEDRGVAPFAGRVD